MSAGRSIAVSICFGVAVSCTILSKAAEGAEITKQGDSVISLVGPIEPGDSVIFSQVARVIMANTRDVLFVNINSPGGDVDEAIAIGRTVRKAEGYVFVIPGAKCISSCVFVLAGGVQRVVSGGTVGIHRPFFVNPPNEAISMVLGRYERKAKDYAHEMNVPETLVDDMFSVPPSSIRILSQDELERYRLVGMDPAHEEALDLVSMKRYGLNRLEYNRRMGLLNAVCSRYQGSLDQMHACVERVMTTGTADYK